MLISKCLENRSPASESPAEHSRSVSGWSGWPADDFLEFLFAVENIISMMNFRRQKIREIIISMRNCVWMTRSFTSHPGGNKGDGLPPASSDECPAAEIVRK